MAGNVKTIKPSTPKPAAKGQLPWVVFFLAFFLAMVHAVTEGIWDSPTFDINESNVF